MPTERLDRAVERAAGGFVRVLATADVVYDGLGLPRAAGAVVVQRAPGVTSVVKVWGAAAAREAYPEAVRLDCGFAVSPPVVNAHTDLGSSTMPPTPGDLAAHLASRERGGRGGMEAVEAGLAELRAVGATVIGGVVADEAVMERLLAERGLSGVAYWEVVAPRPEDADSVFAGTVERLKRFRGLEREGGMRVGLAPQAPHAVSAPLLTRLVGYARAALLPLAIRVAESPAERELHLTGRGELAERLAAAGAPFPARGVSPVRYLMELDVLAAAPTLLGMTHVDEEDVRLVARAGSVVVHSPRTDGALGRGEFPWTLYSRHGVELAFGTGARGKSPDLDVTGEVRAALAAQGEKLNPRAAVRAAVKGGYKALGVTPPRVQRGSPAAELVAWMGPGAGSPDRATGV